mgnify:CR=1 FL=1
MTKSLGDTVSGDGVLDTPGCDYGGSDCDWYNKMYPNCFTVHPLRLGDNGCNLSNKNTECGFDDGDCNLNVKVSYYIFFGTSLPAAGLKNSGSPYKTGMVQNINFRSGYGLFAGSGRSDHVAALFEGNLDFGNAGETVKLCLTSDDGSKLKLNGSLIIDHDGLHGDEKKCIEVNETGVRPVELEYFEHGK